MHSVLGYTRAMQGFMDRYHKIFLTISSTLLVAVAFYTGFLEGKRTSDTQPVTLSCKDDVLDKLSIPLENIIKPSTANAQNAAPAASAEATARQGGKYMGSKNGTKYYLPTCSSAKRIKPENYIWFPSAEEAQIQGYTAGKC
jgi:hypothetical protein